ncbi:MAG: O-antigen ligase family protein [Almyronema sp.]
MMAYWHKVRPALSHFLLRDFSEPIQAETSPRWRGQALGWFCLAALIFFTWLPASYFRMVGWPWILIWQLGFLAMGIWVIWMLRQFAIPFRPLGYGLDWLVGLTALGLVLSASLSDFPTVAAWNIALVLGYGLLLYGWVNYIAESTPKRYLLWGGLALTSIITSLISLFRWQPSASMWQTGDFSAAIRNAAPFGHHNFVGGYFVLVLPLVTTFALAQRGWRRWVGLLAALIVLCALYVSGSRGAYLGFLVWAIAAMGVTLWRSRGPQRQRWIVASLVGLIVIVAGIGSNPRIRDLIGGIHINASNSSNQVITVADGPTQDRYFMLQTARNIWRDRPLLGVGPGNMARVSNLYRPIETGTGLDHVQQLHNTPVQLAGELGLVGLSLYVGWLVALGGLWLRLVSKNLEPRDRLLLYGVGGSFLAYGISSLTDYQLENIGIAATLVINVVLLASLASSYLQPLKQISRRLRRIVSLGSLAGLAVAFRLWAPMDVALALSNLGVQEASAADFVEANYRWTMAANLVPWDPTYGALAGQQLLPLQDLVEDPTDQETLQAATLDHFQAAFEAAPYDVWFNQNLAVLHFQQGDLDAAEYYLSRTAQLLPRNKNYTYYLLGQVYLAQGKLDQAVSAFALEGLTNPQSLTFANWEAAPLASIRPAVLEKFSAWSLALLGQVSPEASGYQPFYENAALVHWWFGLPFAPPSPQPHLRPLLQALLEIDQQPQQSLQILNQAIADNPEASELALLRAWLQPDTYFDAYLDQVQTPEVERAAAKRHVYQYRDIRQWLASLPSEATKHSRFQLAMAYRNQSAQKIKTMLGSESIIDHALVDLLSLFSLYPREFPALDRFLESRRSAELSLPHPTQNHFQITRPLSRQ